MPCSLWAARRKSPPPRRSRAERFGFGGEASDLLINEALNSTVNSRLQRLFGASRIKIDPQGLASETNMVRGPQVTVEQQVASNVTLTYSTNVSVSSQQIIQVEYNITRNISIVALRDQNGVVSFDLRIRSHPKEVISLKPLAEICQAATEAMFSKHPLDINLQTSNSICFSLHARRNGSKEANLRVRVFYHDKCFDGARSAALFSRFYRERIRGDVDFVYSGLLHRAGALFDESQFDGDENAIVDFKYSSSPKITWWFDHHESAFLSPADAAHFEQDAEQPQVLRSGLQVLHQFYCHDRGSSASASIPAPSPNSSTGPTSWTAPCTKTPSRRWK